MPSFDEHETYKEVEELTNLNPDQVLAGANHATFVVGNQIWGLGSRIQSEWDLTKFDLPDEDVKIKKVFCGKFNRNVLTTDDRLFWMGQNRYQNYGDVEKYAQNSGFAEFDMKKFRLQSGETIEKIDAGKYFFAFITSKGRLFYSGKVESSSNSNSDLVRTLDAGDDFKLFEILKPQDLQRWTYKDLWCN